MKRLRRTLIITLVAFACCFSAKAINLEEFITTCETICEVEPIKLSGDLVPQLKNEKIDNIVVFKIDSIVNDIDQKILDVSRDITKTDDMIVVKHNEYENEIVQVFIQPQNDKAEIVVVSFDEEEGVVVYLKGDIQLMNRSNMININGKDIVKEAIKERQK